MADFLDNPAGRLLALFQKARSISANRPSLFHLWAEVFEIQLERPKAEEEVLLRLIAVKHLIDDLEEQIKQIEDPDEQAEFTSPIGRFRSAALTASAASTSAGAISLINDSDLIVLKFCSRYLHNRCPEPLVDDTELERLGQELNDLFNKVANSKTLESDLRQFLLIQIEKMLRGIQEYRIGGIERLREALGVILGSTLVNESLVKSGKGTEELRELAETINHLAALVEFAWKTTRLLETTKTILPLLLH